VLHTDNNNEFKCFLQGITFTDLNFTKLYFIHIFRPKRFYKIGPRSWTSARKSDSKSRNRNKNTLNVRCI
jgi:hypothetical protein